MHTWPEATNGHMISTGVGFMQPCSTWGVGMGANGNVLSGVHYTYGKKQQDGCKHLGGGLAQGLGIGFLFGMGGGGGGHDRE